mmetsp:Transcript_9948/g.31582  ORF Transcript_9948/g.31582 Transcript_9948/m.31582 type:complete len:366 (-) Transcript_9948:1168-2265(-)
MPHRHAGHLGRNARQLVFDLRLLAGVVLEVAGLVIVAIVEAAVIRQILAVAGFAQLGPGGDLLSGATPHARMGLGEHAVDDAHVVPDGVQDGAGHPAADDPVFVRLEHEVGELPGLVEDLALDVDIPDDVRVDVLQLPAGSVNGTVDLLLRHHDDESHLCCGCRALVAKVLHHLLLRVHVCLDEGFQHRDRLQLLRKLQAEVLLHQLRIQQPAKVEQAEHADDPQHAEDAVDPEHSGFLRHVGVRVVLFGALHHAQNHEANYANHHQHEVKHVPGLHEVAEPEGNKLQQELEEEYRDEEELEAKSGVSVHLHASVVDNSVHDVQDDHHSHEEVEGHGLHELHERRLLRVPVHQQDPPHRRRAFSR